MPRDKKNTKHTDDEIIDLIEAFKYFDKTTTALNQAYRTLEAKIDDLRSELEEKNRLLSGTVAEATRVKNFLSQILENMSSGVIAIDTSEKITLFNKMAGIITGFNPHRCINKLYSEIFSEQSLPEHSLPKTLHSEKTVYKQEKSILTKDRKPKPVLFSTLVILNENEEIVGAVEIFEDLTEIKKLQEEIRRHQTLVELGEMAADIAHEIRNPLGGIGGFATLLDRDLEGDPDKQKLVRRIIEGIDGLNKITSDALLYSKKMEPDFRPVNIKQIVQDALGLVAPEADNGGIKIEFLHPYEDIEVSLDPDLFKRMLINLLKNAFKAMPDGGILSINLAWKLLHNQLSLKIKDTGVGIEKDNLPKIFNPFFTTDSKGTGLGLAIVRRIAEVHNGTVKVESEIGKGSEFTINIPILHSE
jgi:PAS domain S-box-containing protein